MTKATGQLSWKSSLVGEARNHQNLPSPEWESAAKKTTSVELLFCKAFFGLLAFDLLGLGRNFARLHRAVSTWRVAPNRARPDLVDRVCRALNYACAWYPKQALCLQRAVVATCLLRRYGVPAEMVLGGQRLPFKAHAWVEVAGRAVNERSDVQRIYAVWERC